MAGSLYAKLNTLGKKEFKILDKTTFAENFEEYAKLGLPAHKAALDGNVECLKECFSSSPIEGIPSRDVHGATPLHLAARNNRTDVVKWLIHFTDLTPLVTAKHGETPVHVAAAQGHVESLKVMVSVDGKGDVKAKLCSAVDDSGFSVLHLAIMKNENVCAKLLVNELGMKAASAINESEVTAVHLSASAGNMDMLKMFSTKCKKLLTQEDKEGACPVYYAAQEGRLEALKFLCEKCECSISNACNNGLQPIHAACQSGHLSIVQFIVSRCGNQVIFDTTLDGATPLHFAASTGRMQTAEWLISCDIGGSLVHHKDRNGNTAAHIAAASSNISMLKMLLESGADLYAINNDGNTPYSIALQGGNKEIANFVMMYASKIPQEDSGGPVRIFNMQGQMEKIELSESTDTIIGSHPPHPPLNKTTGTQFTIQGKESKKVASMFMKKKTIVQKGKRSKSIMENTAQTLQSLGTSIPFADARREETGVDLSMTDDELALFGGEQQSKDPDDVMSSEDPDNVIVVRYSGPESMKSQLAADEMTEPGYSTVQEIATMEGKKRDQKCDRNIPNSLNKLEGKKERKCVQQVFDSAMELEQQFPSQNQSHCPPNTRDAEEVEAGHFDVYSIPDPAIVKMKRERMQQDGKNFFKKSEKQKSFKDSLQDLSGDESPPEVPRKTFLSDDGGKVLSQISVGSQKSALSVKSEQSMNTTSSCTKIKPTSEQESSSPEFQKVKLQFSLPMQSDTSSKFPELRLATRDPGQTEQTQTELSKIKLKRTGGWKRAEYSHPENETTSGASDELKNILKKKVYDL